MIQKLLTVLLMLIGTACFSQNNSLGKNDPDAKVILDKVSAKFKTYKSVQLSFVLKIENASGKVMGTKKGTVYMKGSRYRVSVTDQEIYSDGTNIWTYDKSANEVQITKFDPSANTITPEKMFTNFYDKDFLYKLNGETKQGGKVIQEIELTPVDKTKSFFKVIVEVDKKSQSISSTRIFQKTGDRYTYSIAGLSADISIPDSKFVFNAKDYPGVDVIDLR
ncbi:MAG TPA: outer membrane lipoprotein carrier protein LolA [Chitinophagaceae bacterium]|nr:outer membrane lipoprotein carrier protein LolA [Chitinophagaceae bacterium]